MIKHIGKKYYLFRSKIRDQSDLKKESFIQMCLSYQISDNEQCKNIRIKLYLGGIKNNRCIEEIKNCEKIQLFIIEFVTIFGIFFC